VRNSDVETSADVAGRAVSKQAAAALTILQVIMKAFARI
jgi:hypothetical protein